MSNSTRKLIGVLGGTFFLLFYCLAAMVLGAILVNRVAGPWLFAYFVLAGIAWLPGMMTIIKWMSRPRSSGDIDPSETVE